MEGRTEERVEELEVGEGGEKDAAAPLGLQRINFESFAVLEPPPIEEKGKEKEEAGPPKKKRRVLPSIEDELSMRELMAILAKCSKDFPEQTARVLKLRGLTPKKLDKLTEDEVGGIIKLVRFEIGAKTGGIINDWAKDVCTRGYENFCVGAGLMVKGIASIAMNDPEFNDLWNEFSIDYMHLCYIDPKYRLIMYIFKTTYMVHTQNKGYMDMSAKMDSQPPVRLATEEVTMEQLIRDKEIEQEEEEEEQEEEEEGEEEPSKDKKRKIEEIMHAAEEDECYDGTFEDLEAVEDIDE